MSILTDALNAGYAAQDAAGAQRRIIPSPEEARRVMERLLARIRKDRKSGCWVWTGCSTPEGYGRITVGKGDRKRSKETHRVTWAALVGPLTPGLMMDHKCRTRICCNPEHLREVTAKVNALENSCSPAVLAAAKTHCKNGHEFNRENTRFERKRGFRYGRVCRACKRQKAREYKRLKRYGAI